MWSKGMDKTCLLIYPCHAKGDLQLLHVFCINIMMHHEISVVVRI